MDSHYAPLIEQVAAASAAGAPLCIRGGGSKDFYGGELVGAPLDTQMLTGVIDYDPSELVLTARGGTRLREIETRLSLHDQMLAFEPPYFGVDATLGGVIAAGLSGPRRASSGGVRDFMLGARLLDGRAQVLSFGGRVMKNVAGYDVSRLLAGSLGIFGVILEASLKVLPRPPQEMTLHFEMDEVAAIATLNRWAGQPLPISASAWSAGHLALRLSGSEQAVAAAITKLGGQSVDNATGKVFWNGLREQTDPFFASGARLWRLSVPSTAAPFALAGHQLIEWGGAERWLFTDHPDEVVRGAARAAGGHATVFRGGDRSRGVFMPLAEVTARLHRGLKQAFDPKGIFCRGRLYPGF